MTSDFKTKKVANARPIVTTEEWIEKKKAEKNDVYSMIDDTASLIVSDPEKLKAFLDTQSRMDRYSAANALLIYRQRPDATQLKSFSDWGEQNVQVQGGESHIKILDPVEYTKNDGTQGVTYNVKKVFDISQTNGKRQAPSVNRDPRQLVAVMLDTAPIEVESVDELPYPNMGAFYNNDKQTLCIKRDIGDSVVLCQCVAQELGHAQLAFDNEAYSRKDTEFQAACIGYMLCKKFGVDTRDFAIDHVPDELKNAEPKAIRDYLSKARAAMSEIYSRVSDELYRQRQKNSQDRER